MSAASSNPSSLHLGQLRLAALLSTPKPRHLVADARIEVLRTPRLMIRCMNENDARKFVRVARENCEYLDRYMPLHMSGESDEEMVRRHLMLAQVGDATGRDWRRLIFDMSGNIVGGININDIRRGLVNHGEFVVWIAQSRSRQGFAFEAMAAAIDHAFAPLKPLVSDGQVPGLGLDRLDGMICPTNIRSARLAVRLGFEKDDSLPPIELVISGRSETHIRYVRHARPTPPVSASMIEAKHLPPSMRAALDAILRIEDSDHLW